MRVLKFGGSSLADAERFRRAADIIANNAQQEEVAVVPLLGKTTNKLVAVIESALRRGEVEAQIVELESSFYALLDGIKAQLLNLYDSAYQQQVHSSMTQLRQFVHGITMLGMCPDNVNARIISKGERVSIQLMKAVMEAKGRPANLVDPGKYRFGKGSS